MSHFYGTLRGQANTIATRRGNKSSGLTTTARSWDAGIVVTMLHEKGKDTISIYLDKGSNRTSDNLPLFQIVQDNETKHVDIFCTNKKSIAAFMKVTKD